ncbi:MAG: UDP-N-acetylmuramate dehydrogenase [Treponema sp.]|jgi:UDP-N-acetylmuramate dehydrogenase|nr:UDP-N-acetylmuramate dehydrogenase [Treponema sp.]
MVRAHDILIFLEQVNKQIPFKGTIRYDEPLSAHTTFKVGGTADVWICPSADVFQDYAAHLLTSAYAEGIRIFILGGGANTVPSDAGFRGIVLDSGGYTGLLAEEADSASFAAGTRIDTVAALTADRGWGGFEFLAGMPGSVGGAVYMNARCYETSVSDRLMETTVLELEDRTFRKKIKPFRETDFGYKKSPFQYDQTDPSRQILVLSAKFSIYQRESALIREEMDVLRKARETKGHYRFPSAGSSFKNNHAFGKPVGKIIDELGLRGLSHGGAMIAPFHGNIIVNTGTATATDIHLLMDEVKETVLKNTGFVLEPEIIFYKE